MQLSKMAELMILFLSLIFACTTSGKEEPEGEGSLTEGELLDPLEAGWKGQSVCDVVEENAKIRVLKCTFPPGVGHEKHYHDPHVGYTIAGGLFKITDEDGTREVDVKTGISFSNEEVSSHEVQNIGETTALFLIIEYK